MLLQRGLVSAGFKLKIDGYYGPVTQSAVRDWEHDLHLNDPIHKTPGDWPAPSMRNQYYGTPTKNFAHLASFTPPYRMFLSWDRGSEVSKITCHEKIASQLERCLIKILKEFGQENIERSGLHLYGGCYNHRSVRGGNSWSDHAYGCAIDLNPDENGLRTPWDARRIGDPGYATMPVEAIKIFESFGFCNLGRHIGRDAMHFAAVKYY